MISIIGVTRRFRSKLAKLLLLDGFELRLALIVRKRTHIFLTWLFPHYDSPVVLTFDSGVTKGSSISWNNLLSTSLTVIWLVSISDTNVAERWFTMAFPIQRIIISRYRTSARINLIPSFDPTWSPLCRCEAAVDPNRHLLLEPLTLINLDVIHILMHHLVTSGDCGGNRASGDVWLGRHAHCTAMVSCVSEVLCEFLLGRGTTHWWNEDLFLIQGCLLSEVRIDTLISSRNGSGRSSSLWKLLIIPTITWPVAKHCELTAAGSDIDYLFHLWLFSNFI